MQDVLDIQEQARDLLKAYDEGKLVPKPSERRQGFDLNAAYSVAAEIVKLRRARGECCVGRKIGFTNRKIWLEYGATAPNWGHVYASTLTYARGNEASVSLAGSVAPKIEPEIAFRLRAPIPTGCSNPAVIIESIEWLAPSFEIVDCHFSDWKFQPPDSIADQSLHWKLIVGALCSIPRTRLSELADQIRDCKVTLKCNGEVQDSGIGSNALDHPALALAFLADILATQPQMESLAAGEVITTGTLTRAFSVKPGETWVSEMNGLPIGSLSVTFTA
jgi:2-keto-4-pentenoate hydratase